MADPVKKKLGRPRKGERKSFEDLTKMQQCFVEHYIRTNNATEAARLAGYSEKELSSTANKLAKDPLIKTIIEALKMDVSGRFKEEAGNALQDLLTIRNGIPVDSKNAQLLRIRAEINRDILDRAGFKPGVKLENGDTGPLQVEFVKPAAMVQPASK